MSVDENEVPVGRAKDTDPVEPDVEAKTEEPKYLAVVHMNNQMYPPDTLIEVPGLGGIPNGGIKRVDLYQMLHYEQATGNKWPEENGKAQDLTIEVPPKVEEAE